MVDKRLVKREISNLKMLFNIARTHGFSVFLWSFADGMCRRLHLNTIYQKTHFLRHEACKKYLKKKYYYIIEKYKSSNIDDIGVIGSESIIWRYWHQGVEHVPYPVDITLDSTKKTTRNHVVNVLDAESYKKYISVPDYIETKCQNGQMNMAVFSDYLRLALLNKFGGVWLDSTFYINTTIPECIDDLGFYTINHGNKRKWIVTRDKWSIGLLACAPNNPLISFCEEFLREYWKNEITPVAYLMTDCIIGIGYDEIPAFRQMIDSVPVNNTHCFDYLSNFRNEQYDENKQKIMNLDTYVYQLSYKFDWKKETADGGLSNFGGLITASEK